MTPSSPVRRLTLQLRLLGELRVSCRLARLSNETLFQTKQSASAGREKERKGGGKIERERGRERGKVEEKTLVAEGRRP